MRNEESGHTQSAAGFVKIGYSNLKHLKFQTVRLTE